MTTTNREDRQRGPSQRDKAFITPTPGDEALAKFLIDLWENGHPERIVLAIIYGSVGMRMKSIDERAYKANAPHPGPEALTSLANDLVRKAQGECDVFNKPTRFAVLAYDSARGASYYARQVLSMQPSGMMPSIDEVASGGYGDEDDPRIKLLERQLEGERKDKRWMMEMFSNTMTGVMERDDARMERMEQMLDQTWEKQTKYMAATEQMLNQAQERKESAAWAEMKREVVVQAWTSVKGFLPGIVAYATKGQAGVVEGLKTFIDSLTQEQGQAIFGRYDEKGQYIDGGFLTREQVDLFRAIIDGKTDSSRVPEFISSLTPDQFNAAQQVLSPSQIGGLMAVANAVKKANEAKETEAAK